MTIPILLDAFEQTPFARELVSRLPGRGTLLRLGGLPGSSGAALAAWLSRAQPQRLVVVVTGSPGEAERWLNDLQHLGAVAARTVSAA